MLEVMLEKLIEKFSYFIYSLNPFQPQSILNDPSLHSQTTALQGCEHFTHARWSWSQVEFKHRTKKTPSSEVITLYQQMHKPSAQKNQPEQTAAQTLYCTSSIHYDGAWQTGFTVNTAIQALVEITSKAGGCSLYAELFRALHTQIHSTQPPLWAGGKQGVSWRNRGVSLLLSVWAIWCHTFLTRLILRAGDKLWNQLS